MTISHEDIDDRLRRGEARFTSIEHKLDQVLAEMGTIRADVCETRELVEVWTAAKTFGKFVKWAAGLTTGLAGLWIVLKASAAAVVR
jgi:hypothetical protein